MANNADETKAGPTTKWPYTSFKTLLNLIHKFEADDAVPPRIDRSVLGGSEGQKTQVMSAMKFLGWINESGEVQPIFTQLVRNEKDRAKIFKEQIVTLYPEASKLAAVHATTAQYGETFAGLNGETLRKAMTFYMHAAKFAGVSLSKNFKVQQAPRSTVKKAKNGNGGTEEELPPPPPPPTDAKARYLDMLLNKASADATLDKELLDRIERLIGVPSPENKPNA